MNVEDALRDLAVAVADAQSVRSRTARLRAPRQVVAERCAAALQLEARGELSLPAVIRWATGAPGLAARRYCALLVVHALAVPGLVPAASAADVCSLVENALRRALVRAGYPFGGSNEEKLAVLERLHTSIGVLMQPLEPTFPSNIQGLYAG